MKLLLVAGLLSILSFTTHAQDAEPATKKEQVFTFVEQMPAFPGGEQAMYKYIKETLRYPEEAMDEGLEGRVYIKFIVSETGEIKDVMPAKPAEKSLQDEAIRIISSMPNWTPGKQNGRAVSVYFTLPISFKIEQEAEEKE